MQINAPTPREQEALAILRESNAILADDHFVYISGDHGSGWIDKDTIFIDPRRARRLGELLAGVIGPLGAEVICGPATGGLIVAQWTAVALQLPAVFAEHDSPRSAKELRGKFDLHRGFDRIVAGRKVIVVDDVVNTGHSVRQTVAAVQTSGGNVLGVAALVDRGNVDAAAIGTARYDYLLEVDIPDWPAEECPLCREQKPISTSYAHGLDFLEAVRSQSSTPQ